MVKKIIYNKDISNETVKELIDELNYNDLNPTFLQGYDNDLDFLIELVEVTISLNRNNLNLTEINKLLTSFETYKDYICQLLLNVTHRDTTKEQLLEYWKLDEFFDIPNDKKLELILEQLEMNYCGIQYSERVHLLKMLIDLIRIKHFSNTNIEKIIELINKNSLYIIALSEEMLKDKRVINLLEVMEVNNSFLYEYSNILKNINDFIVELNDVMIWEKENEVQNNYNETEKSLLLEDDELPF